MGLQAGRARTARVVQWGQRAQRDRWDQGGPQGPMGPTPKAIPVVLTPSTQTPVPSTPLRRSEWRDSGAGAVTVDTIDVTPSDPYEEATLRLSCDPDLHPKVTLSLGVPLEREYVDEYTKFADIAWRVDGGPERSTNRAEYRSGGFFSTTRLRRVYYYTASLRSVGLAGRPIKSSCGTSLKGMNFR